MNALLISDLHLTALPRDEYRWKLFDWLVSTIPQHHVADLIILGDLTEAKDFHSARLVNRIVDNLLRVFRCNNGLFKIHVLRGNHDGTDPGCAYFRFLGQYPAIEFIETPFETQLGKDETVLYLPHSRNPVEDWKAVSMNRADLILMHATVKGSVAENGIVLDGTPPEVLRLARRGVPIFSGDVHVPQTVGRVQYVGAPYPIRFGDTFKGRAVLLDSERKATSLPIPSIQRRMITAGAAGVSLSTLKTLKLGEGDQIKVRVRLTRAEYGDWGKAKKNTLASCEAAGVECHGLELERPEELPLPEQKRMIIRRAPADILSDYCSMNKVPKHIAEVGQTFIQE
jgi:hypothetical protein